MDLVNLLSKLQAIEVQEGLSDKQKEIAKQAGDPDKIEGEDFAALRGKKKANEDIFNVLQGLKAIQEGPDPEEDGNEDQPQVLEAEEKCEHCGEVHEGACDKSKVEECGDMEMSPLTNPTAGYDMAPMAAMAQQAEPEMAAEPEQEEKAMYTLTVTNGENNLTMRTDVPDEIIHVMKLAGVGAKAEIKKAPEQGQEKEVEEAWENTPDATNERDPKPYGDIRDWGFKGTGKGKPGFGDRRAPGQGDNPLAEAAIFNEYKSFKAKK